MVRGDGGHTVDGPAAPYDMTPAPPAGAGAGAGPVSMPIAHRVATASSGGRGRRPSRAVTRLAVVPALGTLSACGSRKGSSGNAGGKQLMLGWDDGTGNPPNLDIQMNLTALSAPMAANVCQGLTQLSGEGEAEPLLAASWRKTGDLTWEFSIRKGVKFSDGEEFTAKSAAFSISQAAVNASQNGGYWPAIKSAKASSPDTAEVTASTPGRSVPRELAVSMMVPQRRLRTTPMRSSSTRSESVHIF
jgi:ABC-type transport system substrate-binding protein